MRRLASWLLAFALGLGVGWWGHAVQQPATAPDLDAVQQLLKGEQHVLTRVRAESNAHPNDFPAASAYAVRLLRVLEQRTLLAPLPEAPSAEERELGIALQRCEGAARTPKERDEAAGLQNRATALLRP